MVISNQIVLRVVSALEARQIPYMLVGSYSSNAFGIARSTKDADFVIELGNQSITTIADDLKPDIILDPQLSFETATMTSRFVARHSKSGFKIELFLLGSEPFDRARFDRRRRESFLNTTAMLPSPEDVIIQKLRWFARIRRAKDIEDAGNVVAVRRATLDLPYIRSWCDQHNTRDLFERLLLESQKFEQEHP
jgi:hypothetical protein